MLKEIKSIMYWTTNFHLHLDTLKSIRPQPDPNSHEVLVRFVTGTFGAKTFARVDLISTKLNLKELCENENMPPGTGVYERVAY